MGLFEGRQSMQGNVTDQGPSIAVLQADQSCKAAKDAVKEAIQALGGMYFEANQNNEESEFYDQIAKVKKCKEKEKLLHLYRLSLEGKTQCDSCGAIVTADSAFCNKCGADIKPRDFSFIGISQMQSNNNMSSNVCPSCGSPLVVDALFCEKCGYKISGGV